VKIRQVSADALQPSPRAKAVSPREQRRIELERKLARVIRSALQDPSIGYRLTLDRDEKAATVRAAFNRVKARAAGASGVNLFKSGNDLVVAQREQTRGRRPSAR